EEEQLVLFDWSTHAAAKLILFERRLGGIEKVPSVERAVAQKLIRGPMQVIRARFGDRIHDGPIAAELGTVGVGENRELRNRLNTKRCAHDARSGTMVPETLNISAVQKIGLAFRPRAGDAKVLLDAVQEILTTLSDLGSRRDAGNQRNQIREVASVQRQIVNLF